MTYLLSFPERLKYLRLKKGLTQEQLAETAKVSMQTVYNWEKGIRQPRMEDLQKLADLFEIPAGDFFAEENDRVKQPEIIRTRETVETNGKVTIEEITYINVIVNLLNAVIMFLSEKVKKNQALFPQKLKRRLIEDLQEIIDLLKE